MPWKFVAERLNGDGTGTLLDLDVPLTGNPREDLSGPGYFYPTITPEVARLKVGGKPLFIPWSTALYLEQDGIIRHGFIVIDLIGDGPTLELECIGFTGYMNGMPWTDEDYLGVQQDPIDLVRRMWNHVQAQQGGNLGVLMPSTTSPVRVGTELVENEFVTEAGVDVSFESGPYKLAVWLNQDLGREINGFAERTPFAYRIKHEWDPNDDRKIIHRLEIGYPRLGSRRHDLRFVVGENIFAPPPVIYSGEEYASEVVVLGAGEGRAMVRSDPAARSTGRLRRVAVVAQKDIRNKAAANALAAVELALRIGDADLDELVVVDHPHAPFGSFDIGDDIAVGTTSGWTDELNLWVRITALQHNITDGTITVAVQRSDRLTQ